MVYGNSCCCVFETEEIHEMMNLSEFRFMFWYMPGVAEMGLLFHGRFALDGCCCLGCADVKFRLE